MLCIYIVQFDFFFFKQKTAYEMRISDWSSDVCSSDLQPVVVLFHLEDAPGIGALALEHAGAVVQPVTEHVQLGVAPGHRLAVVPDDAVTVVEWDYGHRLFRPQNLANFVDRKSTRLNSSH